MTIRELTPADGESVWNLRLLALRESPDEFGSTYQETAQNGKDSFLERLKPSDARFVYLGSFDPDLNGMVGVVQDTGLKSRHKCSIISMYVRSTYRRKGVGRELLAAAVARARGLRHVEQICLGVMTTNPAARRLYASAGFTTYGIEPRSHRWGDQYWDEELMILHLKPWSARTIP